MRAVYGFVFLLVTLASTICQAGYVIQSISNPIYDARRPTLACSPSGTLMVAWAAEDFGIWSQAFHAFALDGGAITEPVYHGPGHTPAICWTAEGFVLAYTSGSQVIIRQGSGDTWLPGSHVIETGGILDWTRPDLAQAPSAGLDSAWLTFDVRGSSYLCDVWFVRVTTVSWQEAEILVSDIDYPASPRVTHALVGTVLEPRVYYLCNFFELQYRQRSGPVWSEPMIVPGEVFGMDMDANAGPDMSQCILSLGPQPPCPCNNITFTHGLADGYWSLPENLTSHYDYFDWPLHPAIDAASSGVIHAFWYQIASNEEMEETHWSLEYRIRENGNWIDRSEIFSGHYGPGTDITLTNQGYPIFTWTRLPAGQNGVIMLARPDASTPVEEHTPSSQLALTTWPNPFNPTVTISFTAPESESPQLSIYDPRGRILATLESEPAARNHWQAVWNGRDDSGYALPSGIYFVRLQTEYGEVARKIVLAK